MRFASRFYFYQLFRYNKWLAICVLVFFIVNIFFNTLKPTQQTPIYNCNLYAYPLNVSDTFSFLTVEYNNGRELHFERTWYEPKKVLFYNTLNLFISNYIDKKKDYSQIHFKSNWLLQHLWFSKLFPLFTNFPNE